MYKILKPFTNFNKYTIQIKKSQFQQQTLYSCLQKMYPGFEKKNSHCQDQAINHLQNIFPSLNLPQFSKASSVWEVLQKSAQRLPRPGLGDITHTISNMKTVVDSQQLKIQRNMIQIQKCQELIMSQKKSFVSSSNIKYRDQPTALKKQTKLYIKQEQDSMVDQHNQGYHHEYEINAKNEFFSEPEDIDYFEQNNNSQIRQNYDQDEEVKKYLCFDF